MPKLPPPRKIPTNKFPSDIRRFGEKSRERWICPSCESVHHFNSARGCHNPKCEYRGGLEELAEWNKRADVQARKSVPVKKTVKKR